MRGAMVLCATSERRYPGGVSKQTGSWRSQVAAEPFLQSFCLVAEYYKFLFKNPHDFRNIMIGPSGETGVC